MDFNSAYHSAGHLVLQNPQRLYEKRGVFCEYSNYCLSIYSFVIAMSILLVSPSMIFIESENLVLRLLISHYFFGRIILLAILLAARWYTSKHY